MKEITVIIPEERVGDLYRFIANLHSEQEQQTTSQTASQTATTTPRADTTPSEPLETQPETPVEQAEEPARGQNRKTGGRRKTAKTEEKPQPARTRGSRKYAPFIDFLNSREEDELVLAFEDVEKILGFDLPDSAKAHRAWWSNTTNHAQGRDWMEAGWRSENVDLDAHTVVFKRTDKKKPKANQTRSSQRPTQGEEAPQEGTPTGKYAPLAVALQNADEALVEFTFDELEEQLGVELPQTAKKNNNWWANSERRSHARAWLEQGYRATDVNLEEGTVKFKRA